jgi:hypothetical protein
MTLHCGENSYDLAWFHRRAEQMTYPPFVESTIGVNVEALFGRRCFSESIGHVRPVYEEVLCGCYSVELA